MNASDYFSKLADRTLEEAESLDCKIDEFIEGLEELISRLQEAKEAAEESHRKTGR